MSINRDDYSSVADYDAAVRDNDKIERLRKKYNFEDPNSVNELYKLLVSGNISFETSLGNDFDDEIYELKEKLKNKPLNDSKKNKNNQEHTVKKTSTKAKTTVNIEEMSPYMKKQVYKEIENQDKKRRLFITIFSIAALCCIALFVIYYATAYKSEHRFKMISNLVNDDSQNDYFQRTTVTATIITDENGVERTILPKFETIYNSNKKLIGWIKIDDTNIDYPVMQCNDNEFYLTHNFDSEEDKAGALFLDYQCDVINGNDNYIIYGHHLTSGRMFSNLTDYESERFFNSHQYIRFDTIYEEHVYQVMYVFRSRLYNEDDVVFKYYQFIDVNSEEEFNSYMNEMQELSFYDTGVTAHYGDKLLTLSTCDYHEENGRFVVVAKRIS